jgi:hypothetical protein
VRIVHLYIQFYLTKTLTGKLCFIVKHRQCRKDLNSGFFIRMQVDVNGTAFKYGNFVAVNCRLILFYTCRLFRRSFVYFQRHVLKSHLEALRNLH